MRRLTMISACLVAAAAMGADKNADREAILESAESYVAAFNRGDAKALAGHWADDAVYVNRESGKEVAGREAIQGEFERIFADAVGERLELAVESVRFVTTDVAVEDGVASVHSRGELPARSNYTAVHVKKDGKWYVNSVRETLLPSKSSHYEHLKELEWMVGTWANENEDSKVSISAEWKANRNFLVRSFSVAIKDRLDMTGTQIIGWDPVNQRVRSWVFDSEGGFGSAVWTRRDDRWIIKAQGSLSDGTRASAVRMLRQVDENNCAIQSINREIDGELQPNIDEITLTRATAE
ncbi:MAG: SgcJ/EcaC family oxidoreductase [Planctomycetales bacterium]